MTYLRLVLVRPRSQKYAHEACLSGLPGWEERRRAIPKDDAALLGSCLICQRGLAEPPPASEEGASR